MVTPNGRVPTLMVALRSRVAVSTTETLSSSRSAESSSLPSGVTARPDGEAPTAMLAVTLRLAVSITRTAAAYQSAT